MKIAEARRKELSAGLVWWCSVGKGVAHLLTYTAPHTIDMSLADLMKLFEICRARFKNSRTYKRISKECERAGSVCSAEITYGLNGWHLHLHEILFCKHPLTALQMTDLQVEWCVQLVRAGLGDRVRWTEVLMHALDIRGGEDAADYITKQIWPRGNELTRQHTKETRGEYLTPFGLLAVFDVGLGLNVHVHANESITHQGWVRLPVCPGFCSGALL